MVEQAKTSGKPYILQERKSEIIHTLTVYDARYDKVVPFESHGIIRLWIDHMGSIIHVSCWFCPLDIRTVHLHETMANFSLLL